MALDSTSKDLYLYSQEFSTYGSMASILFQSLRLLFVASMLRSEALLRIKIPPTYNRRSAGEAVVAEI